MLKKIEKFAEYIVYFFDKKDEKQKIEKKKTKISVNLLYYEILVYWENSFDRTVFERFLKNFSSYSQRINFFIVWSSSETRLIISFDQKIKSKIFSTFYRYFPSSKLKETDFREPIKYKHIHYLWDDKLEIKKTSKDQFLKNILKIFDSSSWDWFVKYSLVMNSVWYTQEYAWLLQIFWSMIKSFFLFFYFFIYRLFGWKKQKIKYKTKNQEPETWIVWTTLSIWIWWDPFLVKYLWEMEKSSDWEFVLEDWEKFFSVDSSNFSSLFSIPTDPKSLNWLKTLNYRRIIAPSTYKDTEEDITVLWTANRADDDEIVWIKQEDKARHVYITWKTWVWKSTLLSNMVFSDIDKWRWLALIDPHGDLVNSILEVLPEHRREDLVLFDVSDIENIVWFNMFQRDLDDNPDLLVSTILLIFKKLYWNSRGPRLEYILRNVLLTLTAYPEANFMHILKILTDKNFRKKVLENIDDDIVLDFWENEFAKRSERFRSEAISPITNKVWQFISSPIIRNIFSQSKSSISIKNIMQEDKIFLVNLSKWLIWEDNASMLGSFLVSWIQLETMKKAWVSLDDRKNFTLYIDEFQNFMTDSFVNILSEARKYKLSLVMANQYISQIQVNIQNAIFWNVWNLICFNSAESDAISLSKQFKNQVSVNDILSIPKFKAYAKIMIDGSSSDVFSLNTSILDKKLFHDKESVQSLIDRSNTKYTRPRKDVLQEIKEIRWTKVIMQDKTEKKEVLHEKDKISKNKPNSDSRNQEVYHTVYEWLVKLKFNYGLFVIAGEYEWLLHKKNISLPEWVERKEYFNIWDKIKVRILELKTLDWKTKAVWEFV